jgi:hypothetical protein
MAHWTRGCVLVGGIGFLVLVMIVVQFYTAGQRPLLDIPDERINPNSASLASLVRLPNIGRARAMDIIHYRQNQQQDGPVFHSVQDLESISGIGPKTAQNLKPYLTFEMEP